MSNSYKRLAKNTALLAIGSFASKLLGFFLIPFYTAVLTTAEYGVSDLIVTTTSLIYPFASVAISESIMRFSLDKTNDKKSIFSIGIYTILVGFAVILLFSPIIKRSAIGEYYIFFLLYYITHAIYTISSYFTKGLDRVKEYSISGLISTATIISCNLLFLLYLKIGITGYLFSTIIGHFVAITYLFIRLRLYKYFISPFHIDKQLFRGMLKFSIPIIPNSVSWWIANSSDKYMLNYYADISQVGIYSMSYKIPTLITTIFSFFISAWQISSVEEFGSEESKTFFSNVYNKYVSINVLLASALISVSKIMCGFLYSKDFFTAWRYVPVLISANVFNSLGSFMGSVYTASKNTKMLSISTCIGAASNILMNFIMIPVIGAMGAAIATAASYIIIWLVRIVHSRKIIKFNIRHRRDIILYIILLFQVILASIDNRFTLISSALLCIIECFMLKSFLIEMYRFGISFLRKKLH